MQIISNFFTKDLCEQLISYIDCEIAFDTKKLSEIQDKLDQLTAEYKNLQF